MMRLFPYVLMRVAGESLDKFRTLKLDESVQAAEKIYQLQLTLPPLQAELSELLYQQIADSEKKERRALIQLRRDIFNGRLIKKEAVDSLAAALPPQIEKQVRDFYQRQVDIDRLRQRGAAAYSAELTKARGQLRQLVQSDPLQKGLLLSSQSLLNYGLPHYLKQDLDGLKKKGLKIEQSLIKYLSRICAKTSPFSTFTNLALGKLGDQTAAGQLLNFRPLDGQMGPTVGSHMRLNNFLYRYLRELLLNNPDVYRCFPLRPNPTITREEAHYHFLTNSQNIEAFQRLPFNPVVALIQRLCANRREGVPYREVVQTLVEGEYVDAPADALEKYINQLIAYGFLEFNIGVSGIDPDWDLKLKDQLMILCPENDLMLELCHVLTELRTLASRYAAADVAGRQPLLAEAFERFKEHCLILHEAAGLPEAERQVANGQIALTPPAVAKDAAGTEDNAPAENEFIHRSHTAFYFRPEQMFFEDTALDGEFAIHEGEIGKLVCLLHELLGELGNFEALHDEQAKMRHFFEQNYGVKAVVNLLTFYEEYYRQFKKPESEDKGQQEKNQTVDGEENDWTSSDGDGEPLAVGAALKAIEERQTQNQAWLETFGSLVIEQQEGIGDQIDVSRCQVQKCRKSDLLQPQNRQRNSYGAFVQFFYGMGASEPQGVINATFPGYGKMTSRLLHLFDEDFTTTTRSWNAALSDDDLLIENADASYFNANLHPPLLPFEVWIPGGHNSLPAARQIAATELAIFLDPEEMRLCLRHEPSQKRAYVLDLGFQGRRGRSELFNLLDHFTLANYVSPRPLVGAINRQLQSENGPDRAAPQIQIKPRIVYEQQLVLQRKAWLIPKALLPVRESGESDWEYFARLQGWRLAQRLPDEVFVVLFERGQIETLDPAARARLGRDDYKPQYISFGNPFLVSLFEKLLAKVPEQLKIEEMLPNSAQLLRMKADPPPAADDEQFVTEFVVQWYEEKGHA